jgi:gliding motility-associated-like protein/uncharacterized repeat protein (TIGR01451 family)
MKKLILLFSLSVFFYTQFSAQIVDPFAIRYQINHKGGLVFLSNTTLTCDCAANNEMPPGGTSNNNNLPMDFVDIDADASTFMSSTDQLNLPNCSEIVWAGLYWNGILNNIPANTTNHNIRNQVKLSVNNGAYSTITADEVLDNTVGKIAYFAFKDITSIVQANPINASYRVANVVAQTGANTFGGWTIVVVYRNVFESMKNITVFDGLANVGPGAQGTVNININGFLTPPSGAVNFELGVVAHDGDRGDDGDKLEFNGAGTFQAISDALHDANNAFNSSICNKGVVTPFRNPSFNNNLGYDANIYSPDNSSFGFIGNAASSAEIRVSTESEVILTSVITSAIDIYEPDLRASVTYSDINGGGIEPGDILEFSVACKNIGSDVSTNTFLTDTLDNRLTYIPNSLQVSFGPNLGAKTDISDADQGEFIGADNVVKVRIGTGANGVSGGLVSNTNNGADVTIVKFRAQLSNECVDWQCGDELNNRAYLFGTGQISGIQNSNNGVSDLLDANGCPSLESSLVVVNVNACPPLNVTYSETVCIGETITFSFPSSPNLDLSWTGPNGFNSSANNPSISNAQLNNGGNYTLSILYNNEICVEDIVSPVLVAPNPSIQLNELQNDTCYQAGSGFINVSGIGNGPFSYSWSNSDADSLAQNLLAGEYELTLTDANSCSASQSFTITEPSEFTINATITSNYNNEDISCFNANDGSALASLVGGVAPIDILWLQTGANTAAISNLAAGTYIVEATSNNGCKARDTIVLTQPNALTINGTVTDVLCFGNLTGAINSTVTGGTGPYDFLWSNNAVSEDLINVAAGDYALTVTDANSCELTENFQIVQPTNSMQLSFTSTAVLCNGDASGSIDLSVSGGIEPYDYLWSNNAVSQDLNNIPAGNYSVEVTDGNNCPQTLAMTVTQPSALVLSESHINPVCQSGSQGSINLSAAGGTPNYTFFWNNGENSEDITGLYAGTYSCIVTDENFCTKEITIILSDPDAVTISETHQDVLCYDESTASINITINNGIAPFDFEWSNSATTEDIASLPAGLYFVNVVDNNSCGGFISVTIAEPDTLVYLSNTVINDVSCFGGTNGSITITAAGGTSPYDFLWNTSAVSSTIQNLVSGNYSLTITDDNGCEFISNHFVDQATQLVVTETHTDVLCFGQASGSVDISVVGGNTPYTFLWDNASTNEDLTNLSTGTYSVIVTDDNSCTESISVSISQPTQALLLTAQATDVLCFGGNSGSIDLSVTGGNPNYSYLWSDAQTTEDAINLPAGTYKVVVNDQNLCKDSISVQIVEPQSPLFLQAIGSEICFGANDGVVSVSAEGGTPTYNYLWNNNPNDTLPQLTNVGVAEYQVVVTDQNGCKDSIVASVIQPDDLEGCVTLSIPNIFTPNQDGKNDYFVPEKAFNIKSYSIIILNRWGNVVYEGNDLLSGWDGNFEGKNVSEGVYFWKVEYTDNYEKSGEMHGNLSLVRD